MTNYDIIDNFGEDILVSVRDKVIADEFRIMAGVSKARINRELYALLVDFSEKQKEILKKIIINTIDNCIMELLWRIGENNSDFSLVKCISKNEYIDLNLENPEGLEGIYLTSIDNVSLYNMIDTILETGEIEKKSKPST
jgi:hypothetical protein